MQQNILIIEDEKSIQNILKAFLEDDGYNITLADDGLAGIAAFHKEFCINHNAGALLTSNQTSFLKSAIFQNV